MARGRNRHFIERQHTDVSMSAMSSFLLRNISRLVTFDDELRELVDVDVAGEGGVITAIGHDLAARADAVVIDASELLVLPGLINAHQHLYQVGLRAIPELERALIGPWLGALGQRCLGWWDGRGPVAELVGALAACGLAESALCGVTTTADQHYLHPAGPTEPMIEATIVAARSIGVRLHAGRGTLTRGALNGGSADQRLVQTVDEVVRHAEELIAAHHDASRNSMVRIDLSPCGVHVDLPEVFERFAAMADAHSGVRLHTHCYERVDTDYCRAQGIGTPWTFLERHGWARPDVWLAHMTDVALDELPAIAAAGVGIAHLPAPDLKMGWGCAPLRPMLDAGITVGFGTTGSASNDGANLLGDLRLAALAHRSGEPDPDRWPTVRELLAMATRGSAACLGRPELGRIEVGAAADLAGWDLGTVDRVGVEDPVIGLVHAGISQRAHTVVCAGEPIVRDGVLVTASERELARRANALLARR